MNGLKVALWNPAPSDRVLTPYPGRCGAHDVRWVAPERTRATGASVPCAFAEIAGAFPPDWRPDLFLHWSLEYNPVPEGIEDADCLTVATVGDWNLGGQAVRCLGGLFDLLVADRRGCAMLREAGFSNVRHALLWSFDPTVHRRLPDCERDLDIVFVGNFNPAIQRERGRWLARIAGLSRKYRLCLTSHQFGEEYARLYNRARIVFNRSLRGEANMRVYEAMACGALLFYERESPEIQELFRDREELVLYGEDDLETLLDHYLSHSEERERIAEAGWHAVQRHTHPRHLARLLDDIQRSCCDSSAYPDARGRAGRLLSPEKRYWNYTCHLLLLPNSGCLEAAMQRLVSPQPAPPPEDPIEMAQACARARRALELPDPALRVAELCAAQTTLDTLLAREPGHLAARFNRAQILLEKGDPTHADRELAAFLEGTETPGDIPPDCLSGPFFPRRYDSFLTDLEALYLSDGFRERAWTERLCRLLRGRALEQRAELALARADGPRAARFAASALELAPDRSERHRLLGRARQAMGQFAEAEQSYRSALTDVPIDPAVWSDLAGLLLLQRRREECRVFLEEIRLLLEACPPVDSWRPALRRFQSALERAEHQSGGT